MSSSDHSRKAAWHLFLVFILLTVGIVAAGYLYFQKQSEHVTRDRTIELSTIADLKTSQVDTWRKERLADARMIFENRLLALKAQQLMNDQGSGRLEDELPGWMALREKNEQYEAAFLFDASGASRCVINGYMRRPPVDAPMHVREVLQSRTIMFSDMQEHTDSAGGSYLDLLIPLLVPRLNDTLTVGVLVLRIDPAGALFPLIQAWPLPSRTAETILLRQEGDAVEFLNEPRDRKGMPEGLRLWAGTGVIPAAMVAHGAETTAIGADYRNIPVVAVLRRIPDSPWLLVCKVDMEEINAPIREYAYLATLLVVVLIMAAAANVASIWRRQRAEFYRRQYEDELERHALEKHHAFLTKYANDIILLLDHHLSILDANDRAMTAYGYTRKELFSMTAPMLLSPDARPGLAGQLEALNRDGAAVVETVHQRKDGSTFPVEVSSRVIRVDHETFYQSIMRDITQRKRAEEIQAAIYEISEAANAAENPADLYRSIHRILSALMPAENFYIALHDPVRDVMTFPYFVDQFDEAPEPQKPGRGLTAYVLRTGHPLLASPRVLNDLIARGELAPQGSPSVDWLGVPLKVEEQTIGVMAVQSYTEGVRFGKEETEILSFVSNQVALATQRKQSGEALRKSEVRYRNLVEQLPAVTYVTPLEGSGTARYVSPQVEAMLGYTAEALQAEASLWHPFIHPEDRERIMAAFARSRAERKPFAAEYRVYGKSGSVVWLRDEAVVVHGDDGIPLFMQGLLFDITSRKNAEDELYHSRQMLQLVLDTIPQRVFWKDRQSRFLGCNTSFACDAGAGDPTAVLGKTDFDLSWKDSASAYRTDDNAIMEADAPRIGFEEPQVRANGDVLWLKTSKVPLHDASGNVIGLLGTYEDITGRKRQEESLLKLLRAVEQTDEVIFMTEIDGTITYVNPAFEKIYGFTSSEVLGKTPGVIRSGVQKQEFYRDFWAELLAGQSFRGEMINKSKDGTLICVEASVNPVFSAEGAIVGFIAVQEDISERKKVEDERRNLEAQVMQMQKMESIGTLAGGVAHDFNNILGIILGHCSLITRVAQDPARIARSAEAINKAVQRGAGLVRQILTFARKTDVLFEQVRLDDVITELARMLEETFPKTIDFTITLDDNHAAIEADRTQLHQTLLNLCVNARDAMPDGGTISISTACILGAALRQREPEAEAPNYLRVQITDTGIGMDEQTRLRAFEPFFTTKGHGKGTGLGLAVVYGIIKSHRGFIDVESEVGLGTTFSLYFPLHSTDTPGPAKAEEVLPETAPGGSETVLIVEDEEMLRELLRGLLETKGYTVLAARDGEEAVRIYGQRKEEIAIVVTDMGLPRMSGPDAFARMRELNPCVRVILASGYLEPQVKSSLLKSGARAFVQKPYVPEEVLRIIRATIDHQED